MKKLVMLFYTSLFLCQSIAYGQDWELQLENERIKVYTKDSEDDNIKSYKAFSYINFPAEEIYKVYIDFENYDQWFEELYGLKLLSSEISDTLDIFRYYSIIKFPFLFNDRDMVTELKIKKFGDEKYILESRPIESEIDEGDFVRLKRFYQDTQLIKESESKTEIIMEGKYDAGGAVPAWLMNMFVVESPLNSVENIESYLERKLNMK